MKTTLTFESDDNEDDSSSLIEVECHLRGPQLVEAIKNIHQAVRLKVVGQAKGPLSRAIPPETEPVTWAEVLELLNEHTSDVSDLTRL